MQWLYFSLSAEIETSLVGAAPYIIMLPIFHADAVPRQRAAFGRGCGIDILLDEVGCSGNESILLDCPANPVGDHDCSHSQDAGVQCAMSGENYYVTAFWKIKGPLGAEHYFFLVSNEIDQSYEVILV